MRRKLAGLGHVDLEQGRHDAIRLLRHAGHAVMRVETGVEERLQLGIALGDLGRVLDQPWLHAAHRGQAVDASLGHLREEMVDEVGHQPVDDGAHGLIAQHVRRSARRVARDRRQGLRPQ